MARVKKNIVLIGGGGHCKACIDVIESTAKYNIIGILDLPELKGQKVLNYEIIGNDTDYLKYKDANCSFLITTGQIKSSYIRDKIFNDLKDIDAKIETVISPSATVSKYAKIGEGTIIMHHAIVNADAIVSDNCIINSAAIIEHDAKVGRLSHISTKAVINGGSKIGDHTFIGSNVCVSSSVSITDNVIIGAGSTVVKDITMSGTYVGTPTKQIYNE